jgi:DNA-binding response OmpR family regulator
VLDIKAILIVEDSPTDAMLLKQAFKRAKFDGLVEVVGSADLAYSWIISRLDQKQDLPELVLLDLGLPGETGMEMLEKLKGNPVLKAMRVVVFSGSSRPQDIVQARHLGAEWYFVKKSEPKDLNFVVMELARICSLPSSH